MACGIPGIPHSGDAQQVLRNACAECVCVVIQ